MNFTYYSDLEVPPGDEKEEEVERGGRERLNFFFIYTLLNYFLKFLIKIFTCF